MIYKMIWLKSFPTKGYSRSHLYSFHLWDGMELVWDGGMLWGSLSRWTWGELEQNIQAGRAHAHILTAGRKPGF